MGRCTPLYMPNLLILFFVHINTNIHTFRGLTLDEHEHTEIIFEKSALNYETVDDETDEHYLDSESEKYNFQLAPSAENTNTMPHDPQPDDLDLFFESVKSTMRKWPALDVARMKMTIAMAVSSKDVILLDPSANAENLDPLSDKWNN